MEEVRPSFLSMVCGDFENSRGGILPFALDERPVGVACTAVSSRVPMDTDITASPNHDGGMVA